MNMSPRIRVLALVLALAVPAAGAEVPVPLSVDGNVARGTVHVGGLHADLTITFEQATGLTPSALTVTAGLIDPLDPLILSRLDENGPVGIAGGFPVRIRIEPSLASTLTFNGIAEVSLYTAAIDLDLLAPQAFFSAPLGGTFRDITKSVGSGSYRAGGSSGTFSEFLVVLDTRALGSVITGKYDTLDALLASYGSAMPGAVRADLNARLSRSRGAYAGGHVADAISELDGFSEAVRAASGTSIPDEWRAQGGPVNVAGVLRAGADTLRYSLVRAVSP